MADHKGKQTDPIKRKTPSSPDDLPSFHKQSERQTRARKISLSADDLDKIDEKKVEQIQARKPGVTFNLQELICGILNDDTFIDKLVPKLCEKVFARLDEKYSQIFDEMVKPMKELQETVISQATEIKVLQDTVTSQDTEIKKQRSTIDKHVVALYNHNSTIKKHEETISLLSTTVYKLESQVNELQGRLCDLDMRLDEQEQYSRRTSLRFNNIPCPDPKKVRKMNTDDIVLDICNNKLGIPITLDQIGRTHPIGKVRHGKVQVIARFLSYRQRSAVFRAKSKLKKNPDRIFITENLTFRRSEIMKELNYLRKNNKIQACWSSDGRLFAIGLNSESVVMIHNFDDIYSLLSSNHIPETHEVENVPDLPSNPSTDGD